MGVYEDSEAEHGSEVEVAERMTRLREVMNGGLLTGHAGIASGGVK